MRSGARIRRRIFVRRYQCPGHARQQSLRLPLRGLRKQIKQNSISLTGITECTKFREKTFGI